MTTPQRLPIVNSDDGTWGDILRQYLKLQHYDDGTDNPGVNGGHQNITIRPGVATAGGAPITFSSGTNLTTPAAGAMEYNGSYYYLTPSSGTRKTVAIYDDSSGAAGDIHYRDGSGNFTRLGIGGTGNLLTVASGLPAWTSATTVGSTTPTANTVAEWDGNKNLSASAFFDGYTTTATAAGTTTLTVASTQIQVFTGTNTQTVKLPTTSVPAGAQWRIVNNSTGAVTVQSSGANTIVILAGNTSGLFTALVATPTTAANWDSQYWGTEITSGKTLSASNTLTLAGTDGTTMTFPTTSATIARTDAANTFTGHQTIEGVTSTGATGTGKFVFDTSPTLTTPNLGTPSAATLTNATGLPLTGLAAAAYNTTPTASTLAEWDSNVNLSANTFIENVAYITTSGGTTTLTVASAPVQYFSGTSNQTVVLPQTGVNAGQEYKLVNVTSGNTLTVKAADGTTVGTVPSGGSANFLTGVTTPGTYYNWGATFLPGGSVMNFPYSSGTVLASVTAPATNPISGTPSSSTYLRGDGTWAAVTSGFANPMTTSGDVIYGGASGTATRLAGNTSTTKQFLAQTGTGSASAAPAWATPSAADLSNGVQGSGQVVLATSPILTTPNLGTPSAAVLTNATGTAASLTAGNATKLATARTIQTNLASATSASFDGSANVTPGVTGTLPIANGGTGQATQQTAINALTGTQSSGKYLRSDGTNATLTTIQAADVPTLNQSTTGSAATLTTARTIQTNLASATSASFDGSANVTPGVTGTLPIANGGTGQATQQTAINALTGTQSSGKYLRSDGTNATLTTIQAADVPTLNQSTTGSAATLTTARTIQTNLASATSASFDGSANITPGVTGTLPIANGGTGQATQQAAMNALAGTQSSGKYLRSDGTNTTLTSIVAGDVPLLNQSTTGNAATATSLQTARNIQTNLASTSAVSFNGTADATPGVTGVLGVANGGTGNSSGLATYAQYNDLGVNLNYVVTGSNNGTATALTLWTGTQAQYNALGSYGSTTVYIVT